jgi:hypothetical protein
VPLPPLPPAAPFALPTLVTTLPMPLVVMPLTVPCNDDVATTVFVLVTLVLLLFRKSLILRSLSRIAVALSIASALPAPLCVRAVAVENSFAAGPVPVCVEFAVADCVSALAPVFDALPLVAVGVVPPLAVAAPELAEPFV